MVASTGLKTSTKIIALCSIMSLTLVYSMYHKRHIDTFDTLETPLLLKKIPSIKVGSVDSDEVKPMSDYAKLGEGLFVHLWGTWCAPCEEELPAFLNFAEKLNASGVKFLLLAINDKKKDVKKFMKRYKDLPSNVMVGMDTEDVAMNQLGSAKVPDTYLFDSKGIHLTKFVGPQDWSQKIYYFKTMGLIDQARNVENLVIETH